MKPSIVIVTGLSGSGKTVALRAIEDCGYTCVDNLPPRLIGPYIDAVPAKAFSSKVAVGIDIREQGFLEELVQNLPVLRKDFSLEVLYLEAESDVLLRRFKETRRPHPLAGDAGLEEAVAYEKGLLESVRENADRIVDTSPFNPHQLRQHIKGLYGLDSPGEDMTLTLMSFGFKHGVPMAVDMLFDVRFLPNPHFVPELKGLTGLDEPVRKYVFDHKVTGEFLTRLKDFLDFLIPQFRKEGKAYLTVGIGCTGGRHRSTAMVEELGTIFRQAGIALNIVHRDL
ncbi:RNase adapter RapZ [Nitrospirota bacterium]